MAQKTKQRNFQDLSPRDKLEMLSMVNDVWKLGACQEAVDDQARTTTSAAWGALPGLTLNIVPVRGQVYATFSGVFEVNHVNGESAYGIRVGTSGDPLLRNVRHEHGKVVDKDFSTCVQALFTGLDPTKEVTIQVVWQVAGGHTLTAHTTERNFIILNA